MHGTRGSTPHSARDTWKRSTQCTKHFELPGVTGTPAPQFSKKSAEKKARQGEKTEDGEQSAPRASRRQPYLRDKDCVRRDESESRWCQNSAHGIDTHSTVIFVSDTFWCRSTVSPAVSAAFCSRPRSRVHLPPPQEAAREPDCTGGDASPDASLVTWPRLANTVHSTVKGALRGSFISCISGAQTVPLSSGFCFRSSHPETF